MRRMDTDMRFFGPLSSLREDDWPRDRLCSGDENADGSRPRLKRCRYHMLDIPSDEEGLA